MSDRLWEIWERYYREDDPREIWEWFSEEGELGSGYARSGRFQIDTAPMLKEPLQALKSPAVRHVICMAGIQCLKTLLGEMWLLWLIPNRPGPCQWLQPTNDDSKGHYKDRFADLVKSYCGKYFAEARHSATAAFIKFRNGHYLRMEGAENPKNLQRKSIKYQMRSEIHQVRYWSKGKLKQADSRLTQFTHNGKKYTESQPGWDAEFGVDDMHPTFLLGDQNFWSFACLGCGQVQRFHFSYFRNDGSRAGLRWDTNERTRRVLPDGHLGEWRWGELAQTIRYHCIYCDFKHYDEPLTRRRITDGGLFVPANREADPLTRSFAWSQWDMPNLSWYETEIGGVKGFLLAYEKAKRGDESDLHNFWQKVCNEPLNPAKHGMFSAVESIELRSLSEDEKTKAITVEGPDGKPIVFDMRTMGVDVQEDHWWLLVVLWSKRGDSLVYWAEKVFSWGEVRERQLRFHVPDENVGVDISHNPDDVTEECTRHGHWEVLTEGAARGRKVWLCWKAFRGADQKSFLWAPKNPQNKRNAGKGVSLPYAWPPAVGDPTYGLHKDDPRRKEFLGKRCRIITWSNPSIKAIVMNRRDGRTKGLAALTARGGWNDEFSKHMHSHILKPNSKGELVWECVDGRPDHLVDCFSEATVLARMKGRLGPTTGRLEVVDAPREEE